MSIVFLICRKITNEMFFFLFYHGNCTPEILHENIPHSENAFNETNKFTCFYIVFYRSDTVSWYLPVFTLFFTDPTLCLGIYLFSHCILQIQHCVLVFTCFHIGFLQIQHCVLVFTCFHIGFYRSDTVPWYLPVFTFYFTDLTLCLGIYLFSHCFYRSDTVPWYLPVFAFYFTDPTLCLGIYLFSHCF